LAGKAGSVKQPAPPQLHSILISEKWKELKELMALLRNGDQTEFLVVTAPSKMNIPETKRLIVRLRRLGIPVHRMVVNKVALPNECDFCRSRRVEGLETLRKSAMNFRSLS